jgi:hypothetical protein
MGFCEFDGVGLLPYKGGAILAFITIKFDLLGRHVEHCNTKEGEEAC